jgi:hypothetical protein
VHVPGGHPHHPTARQFQETLHCLPSHWTLQLFEVEAVDEFGQAMTGIDEMGVKTGD